MPRIVVKEGASGIIRWKQDGREETYVPNYDLDEACARLFTLYEIRSSTGKRFKDAFWIGEWNWLSSQMNYIFGRCIYRFVQYAGLIERFRRHNVTPVFANKGNFYQIWTLMHPQRRFAPGDLLAYRWRLPRHNKKLAAAMRPDFLFYRYGPNDFRTKEMLAHFESKGCDFSFVYAPSRKMLRAKDSYAHPVYLLYTKLGQADIPRLEFDLSAFPPLERLFLSAMVERVQDNIARNVAEHGLHLENLKLCRPKLFFGLEDLNRLHPLLFACRELGIPSIGYQTGTYSSRQSANVLHKWGPGEFQYFDHMIVWGRFWEEVTRRNSDAFPDDFFIIGANKHSYAYERLQSNNFHPKNILVPFETLGNTYAVGRYMTKLMDLGYTVYFKLKPDWDLQRQLECYHLPPGYAERLKIVPTITNELMAEINIVGGTMTTLIFDLLPYGKETWVFETEFRLLDDMLEQGYGRKVRLEELERIEPPAHADHHADYAAISNPVSVTEVLDRHVLSRL